MDKSSSPRGIERRNNINSSDKSKNKISLDDDFTLSK